MPYIPTLRFADYAKYLDVEKWLKYRLPLPEYCVGPRYVTKKWWI